MKQKNGTSSFLALWHFCSTYGCVQYVFFFLFFFFFFFFLLFFLLFFFFSFSLGRYEKIQIKNITTFFLMRYNITILCRVTNCSHTILDYASFPIYILFYFSK